MHKWRVVQQDILKYTHVIQEVIVLSKSLRMTINKLYIIKSLKYFTRYLNRPKI